MDVPDPNGHTLQVVMVSIIYFTVRAMGHNINTLINLTTALIDAAGNNGLGEVISKNNAIIVDTLNFGK
ncbi:MAG: hypothetical protein IPP29_05810 [Bacteroidetes bacterium]|nr:hypothetical protein [Bacteroidota bacterium]